MKTTWRKRLIGIRAGIAVVAGILACIGVVVLHGPSVRDDLHRMSDPVCPPAKVAGPGATAGTDGSSGKRIECAASLDSGGTQIKARAGDSSSQPVPLTALRRAVADVRSSSGTGTSVQSPTRATTVVQSATEKTEVEKESSREARWSVVRKLEKTDWDGTLALAGDAAKEVPDGRIPLEGEFVAGVVERNETSGQVRLVWIARQESAKYPLIRYVQFDTPARMARMAAAQAGNSVPGAAVADEAMVADHFIVKVTGDAREEQTLNVWRGHFQTMGCDVRAVKRFSGALLVSFDGSDPAAYDGMRNTVAARPGIVSVTQDRWYRIAGNMMPGDPLASQLWGLNNEGQTGGSKDADIDAPEAWLYGVGTRDAVTAVIDTGIDYNHEDIKNNIWSNPGEIPGNGIDDDGNGVIDDVHGYNAVADNGNPWDDHYHGTHCSGTIAGEGDNGIGVVGVNWRARLMAVKILNQNGGGTASDIAEGVLYVARMKRDFGVNIRVTSNSWGGSGADNGILAAFTQLDSLGILNVVAAGNSGTDMDIGTRFYPACYDLPSIVAVAATDHKDALASFSNYGATMVDLAAPGVNIMSTRPNNTYGALNGTSMACPHVAGAAALMVSLKPSATAAQVRDILLKSADPIPSLAGKVVTGGRLNLLTAAILAKEDRFVGVRGISVSEAAGDGDGVLEPGESGIVTLTVINLSSQTAQNVVLTASSADPNVVFGDATAQAGTLTPNQIVTLTDTISLQVGAQVVTPYPVTIKLTISQGGNPYREQIIGFTLYSGSSVNGTVTDGMTGAPVAGAVVYCQGSALRSTTTDAQGRYAMGGLINGTYAISADKPGVFGRSAPVSVTVPPDRTVNISLNAPKLAVDPPELRLTLKQGETAQRTLTIRNERTPVTQWRMSTLGDTAFGKIVGSFTWPNFVSGDNFGNASSIATISPTNAWLAEDRTWKFHRINPITMQVLETVDMTGIVPNSTPNDPSYPTENHTRECTVWDSARKWLWAKHKDDNRIYALDMSTRQVMRSFNCPFIYSIDSMGYDKDTDALYVSRLGYAYRVDPNSGANLGMLPNNIGSELYGGTHGYYHGSFFTHYDMMWLSARLNRASTMDGKAYGDSVQPEVTYFGPNCEPDGRGGLFLSYRTVDGVTFKTSYRVASGECPWIDSSRWFGDIQGLGTENQTITISASDLFVSPGVYTSTVVVVSTDPVVPAVQVPVTLTVEPGNNQPPQFTGGPTATPGQVNVPGTVTLIATAVDPEGGVVTYYWQAISTPGRLGVEIGTPNSATTAVNLNTVGPHVFMVTATDPYGATSTKTIAVNALSSVPEKALTVSSASLDVSVPAGQQTTRTLTIGNAGWSATGMHWVNANQQYGGLKHTATLETIVAPSDVVFRGGYLFMLNSGQSCSVSLFDPFAFWGVEYTTKYLYNIIGSQDLWGIDHDGEHFWLMSWGQRKLFVVDIPVDKDIQPTLVRTVAVPGAWTPCGVALEGNNIWTIGLDPSGGAPRVYRLDKQTGAVLGGFPVPAEMTAIANPLNLAWQNGSLWFTVSNKDTRQFKVFQVNPTTGAVQGSFNVPETHQVQGVWAICPAGDDDLWISSANYGMDPDTRTFLGGNSYLMSTKTVSWLNRSPTEGVLTGGQTVGQTLTLNAAGLTNGVYLTTMRVLSDDPARIHAEVPVTLRVGASNINRVPVAGNDGPYQVQAGVAMTVAAPGVLSNDSDPDGNPLSAVLVMSPINGTVSLAANGGFTYAPNAGYVGTDRFIYTASDGRDVSAPATVALIVGGSGGVNQPPTCSITSPANGAPLVAPATVEIQVAATDPDGTISKVEFFNGATKLGEDASVPYSYTWSGVPAGTFNLTAVATDNKWATKTSAVVRVNVYAPGSLPVANAQNVTTAEDTAKAITLTGSDPSGHSLTYQIVTGPAHGVLSGVAPNVTYTPVANYNGTDSFTFKVNNGTLDSAAATVNVTVTPVNDPPTANAGPDQTVTDLDNNGIQAVTLDGSGSSDIDGDSITTYTWTEGANQIGTGVKPSVQLSIGTHTIVLTVTDTNGSTGSDTVIVTVAQGASDGGLVIHLKCDEASGTIASDSSGKGNVGTLKNGAAWATGRIGGGLDIRGTNDYIEVPAARRCGSAPTTLTTPWHSG